MSLRPAWMESDLISTLSRHEPKRSSWMHAMIRSQHRCGVNAAISDVHPHPISWGED